jgi:hypothetical protein
MSLSTSNAFCSSLLNPFDILHTIPSPSAYSETFDSCLRYCSDNGYAFIAMNQPFALDLSSVGVGGNMDNNNGETGEMGASGNIETPKVNTPVQISKPSPNDSGSSSSSSSSSTVSGVGAEVPTKSQHEDPRSTPTQRASPPSSSESEAGTDTTDDSNDNGGSGGQRRVQFFNKRHSLESPPPQQQQQQQKRHIDKRQQHLQPRIQISSQSSRQPAPPTCFCGTSTQLSTLRTPQHSVWGICKACVVTGLDTPSGVFYDNSGNSGGGGNGGHVVRGDLWCGVREVDLGIYPLIRSSTSGDGSDSKPPASSEGTESGTGDGGEVGNGGGGGGGNMVGAGGLTAGNDPGSIGSSSLPSTSALPAESSSGMGAFEGEEGRHVGQGGNSGSGSTSTSFASAMTPGGFTPLFAFVVGLVGVVMLASLGVVVVGPWVRRSQVGGESQKSKSSFGGGEGGEEDDGNLDLGDGLGRSHRRRESGLSEISVEMPHGSRKPSESGIMATSTSGGNNLASSPRRTVKFAGFITPLGTYFQNFSSSSSSPTPDHHHHHIHNTYKYGSEKFAEVSKISTTSSNFWDIQNPRVSSPSVTGSDYGTLERYILSQSVTRELETPLPHYGHPRSGSVISEEAVEDMEDGDIGDGMSLRTLSSVEFGLMGTGGGGGSTAIESFDSSCSSYIQDSNNGTIQSMSQPSPSSSVSTSAPPPSAPSALPLNVPSSLTSSTFAMSINTTATLTPGTTPPPMSPASSKSVTTVEMQKSSSVYTPASVATTMMMMDSTPEPSAGHLNVPLSNGHNHHQHYHHHQHVYHHHQQHQYPYHHDQNHQKHKHEHSYYEMNGEKNQH